MHIKSFHPFFLYFYHTLNEGLCEPQDFYFQIIFILYNTPVFLLTHSLILSLISTKFAPTFPLCMFKQFKENIYEQTLFSVNNTGLLATASVNIDTITI